MNRCLQCGEAVYVGLHEVEGCACRIKVVYEKVFAARYSEVCWAATATLYDRNGAPLCGHKRTHPLKEMAEKEARGSLLRYWKQELERERVQLSRPRKAVK